MAMTAKTFGKGALLALGLGAMASTTMISAASSFSWGLDSLLLVGGTVAVAVALTLAAAESTRPLRHRALRQQVRRND